VYRHLVADDAAAIQLLAAEAGDPVVIAATASDGVAGEALKERKWVMDPVGAPPILTAGSPEERASRVGLNPLIDAVSIPTYAAQAVTEAVTIGLWNPEGIDYNPLDDPWRDDVDANLGAQGLRRFDIVQPPLPVGLQAGRSVTPPGPGHFRKMAFYLQGDRIVEIREQISFIDRREYRRAQEGQAPMANIEVIEAAMEGFTDEPVRERRLTYTVEYQDVSVDIPPDAVAGSIGPALGVSGIGAMLVPPPQPGVGPAGVPIPTPGSDDEPEQDELSDTES